jgi:hypothetical protein
MIMKFLEHINLNEEASVADKLRLQNQKRQQELDENMNSARAQVLRNKLRHNIDDSPKVDGTVEDNTTDSDSKEREEVGGVGGQFGIKR